MLENVLAAQIKALEKNIERMTTLVGDKAIQFRTPISGKFLRAISPYKSSLMGLKKRVEGNLMQDQIENSWQELVRIREAVDRVSNQCLDYIGGIAVRKWELEEKICDLAETLVSQSLNQGSNWVSVAIVGEERLLDEVAQTTQIIRLRFPEWGIWSLPFTAYEFGRWIIGEKFVAGLNEFFIEEENRADRCIRTKAVADLIAAGDLPEDQVHNDEIVNLAPDISSLRESFLNGKDVTQELAQTLKQLQAYLKELFADAFGTYFLGPAYPYSRLCLRLNPATALQDLPRHPSLARRVSLMMKMLVKMGERAKEGNVNESNPYEPEVKILADLWESTIKMVQPGYRTDFSFGSPYDSWAESLYNKLQASYFDVGFSHKHWKDAKALGDKFIKEERATLDATSSLPIVLNAAWYSRARMPDRGQYIERVARDLMEAISDRQRGLPEGSQQQAGTKLGPQSQTVTGS